LKKLSHPTFFCKNLDRDSIRVHLNQTVDLLPGNIADISWKYFWKCRSLPNECYFWVDIVVVGR